MIELLKKYKEISAGSVFLIGAVLTQYVFSFPNSNYVYFTLYIIAYLFVGGPVWAKAFSSIRRGNIFTEFFLMGIATVGAFILGEYAEGVAVMFFYMIGEHTQHGAVHKARHSISKLLDQQPDIATVERNGIMMDVHPTEVEIGEIILVKPGEKVPLDGELISESGSFNSAALTGESKPSTITSGESVWAGSINQNSLVRIRVKSAFKDSKLANILNLVEEAVQRKAPTQRFMAKFAKVYTPIVVWLAVALTFLPFLIVEDYVFQDWFYRALIFLVVSCPCGLVISIPLGYFGGIGAASQNGILLKGSDYLDQLRNMDTLFMDKTGTLTEGVFEIQTVSTSNGLVNNELLKIAASLEQHSSHPIAKAILEGANGEKLFEVSHQEEVPGKGLKGNLNGDEVLVGNADLLADYGVKLSLEKFTQPYTYVHVAINGAYTGTISIADTIKPDAKSAIAALRKQGVKKIVMLSGDNQKVVDYVAQELGIDEAYGGLMPEDKYEFVKNALGENKVVGFVGDGVNDAPVIALADVGIAMGGVGSDATIETADLVIQTDHPSKISLSIKIARFTHRVVWENISFAMGTKVLVMGLATVGMANLWLAIFADVGVALIAIANAIRVQNKFSEKKVRLNFMEEVPAEQVHSSCDTCCSVN
ncbi:MAG: heavy metal translocating P-type ATPase [Balneolaceae bacterium]